MENTEQNNEDTVDKKVVKEKVYTVKLIFFDDGSTQLKRTNDGFNVFELLGVLNLSSQENVDNLTGRLCYSIDEMKREVVKD